MMKLRIEMGGAGSTYGTIETNIPTFKSEKLKEQYYMADLIVDGKMALKWILNE
jgi:hypothetical protein